jgi:hypothetical protein
VSFGRHCFDFSLSIAHALCYLAEAAGAEEWGGIRLKQNGSVDNFVMPVGVARLVCWTRLRVSVFLQCGIIRVPCIGILSTNNKPTFIFPIKYCLAHCIGHYYFT